MQFEKSAVEEEDDFLDFGIEYNPADYWFNKEKMDIIKSIHAKYFDYMVNGDMDNVAKLFHYPSAFKGFLDNLLTAKDASELKEIYQDLIASAPTANRISMNETMPFKLRDNTYVIIMSYSQYNDDSEIFSGNACYVFSKINKEWKISAVL